MTGREKFEMWVHDSYPRNLVMRNILLDDALFFYAHQAGMESRQPEIDALKAEISQATVNAWNLNHPVGTVVDLTKDSGEVVRTTTRFEAEVLSGHTAVIWLEGVSGCYCLDRVKVVKS